LCLILLGLVFSAYRERQAAPQEPEVRAAEPTGEKLLTTPIEQIVALRFEDHRGCVLLSQSDGWRIEGVPEAGIDADAIAQLLSTIETARELRTFDSDPLELAQYGLSVPSLIMGVRRKGEGEFRTLFLGDKNPVGNAVYAKWTQDPQVLILGTYFETLVKMMVQRVRAGQKEFSHAVCPD
jgi:hypothetical protein